MRKSYNYELHFFLQIVLRNSLGPDSISSGSGLRFLAELRIQLNTDPKHCLLLFSPKRHNFRKSILIYNWAAREHDHNLKQLAEVVILS